MMSIGVVGVTETAEWKRADSFCKKHFGPDVLELGWEEYIKQAIAENENVETVCAELGDDCDLDDISLMSSAA